MGSSAPLHFSTQGDSNAPTLVLLHEGGISSWMWNPVIPHLPDYHLIIPDLPEYGGSANVGPFSYKLTAQKVAELIQAQVPSGRAHIAGLSAGAQTIVQLLADHPEVIDHALVSSALLLPMPGTSWFSSPTALKWAYRMSIPPFLNNDWWIRLNMKYSAGVGDEYFAQFKKDFQATTESTFVNLMIANQNFRLPAGLEKINVPTLVVTGAKEYAVMQKSAQLLVESLPRAKRVQVNLGKKAALVEEHNWALNAPELFAKTIQAWIRNEPLPSELQLIN